MVTVSGYSMMNLPEYVKAMERDRQEQKQKEIDDAKFERWKEGLDRKCCE